MAPASCLKGECNSPLRMNDRPCGPASGRANCHSPLHRNLILTLILTLALILSPDPDPDPGPSSIEGPSIQSPGRKPWDPVVPNDPGPSVARPAHPEPRAQALGSRRQPWELVPNIHKGGRMRRRASAH